MVFWRRGRAAYDDDRIGAELREARDWLARFNESGQVADLDRAVDAGARALALCSTDAPERMAALLALGEGRAARADATGSTEDLTGSVEIYRELTRLTRAQQPELTGFVLHTSASLLLRLGRATGVQRTVEEAILAARELNELGVSTNSPPLNAAAAELLGLAAPLLPADHADRAALAGLRGIALIEWTVRTGDASRIGEATEEVERAVRLCPADDANRRNFLALLARVRQLHYKQTGTIEALEAMLSTIHDVLDLYPREHPVALAMLHNLGLLHIHRHQLIGEETDLDTAAYHLRTAIGLATDETVRQSAERALAQVVELRGPDAPVEIPPGLQFVAGPGTRPRGPVPEAADDVEEVARHAVALAELLAEFERGGDLALLERICDDGHTLLASLPVNHPARVQVAIPLGPALMRRFEAHGQAADLDEAVDLLQEAVDRPVLFGPAEVRDEQLNLAAALINRFLRDRDRTDLDEAIAHVRRALEMIEPEEPDRISYLHVLGTALVYRARHTKRRFDLDESIVVGQQALASARTSAEVDDARANLGNRLRDRYLTGGNPDDLVAALTHLRAAAKVNANPKVHLNLALALRDRGPQHQRDLLDAADEFRGVLASVPPGSPVYLTARLGLAQVLGDLDRPDEALAVLDGVAESSTGRFERMDALVMRAGLRAALAAEGRGEWSLAARAYDDAVAQLHLTVWRGLDAPDRDTLVRRWANVACDAAAASIAAGVPQRAVELLDHGRSLWWGQVLDGRAELNALRAVHPDLADRLAALGEILPVGADDVERRRRGAREWDEVVAVVRVQPGFAHFLLPTPFAELARAAVNGPVVLVNVSRHRCDALVLTERDVRVVPLPGLTAAQADERTGRYLDAVSRVGVGGLSSGPREQLLLDYLEWLWDTVAAPVLAELPAGAPRLWWCPTGPLALAPLHAAGYHDPDDTPANRAVLDRVVSSTTPTVRALLHARRASRVAEHRPLVVACDVRPYYVTGLPDLPAAAREAELLQARFPEATVLTGAAATRGRVTELLAGQTCVHLACHGDVTADGRAALFLADAPLTTTDLARLDLADAQLVVLSACHTAMGGTDLPDEARHLAAAFQVAGFRQVVSTLWAIGDDTAASVAGDLYDALTAPDGTLDPARAAQALHGVTVWLRSQDPYQPSRWAPFVHYGR